MTGEMQTVSLRLEEATISQFDSWAADSGVSRSALLRDAIRRGAQEMDGAPAYLVQQAAIDQEKDKQKGKRRSGWFRTNFSEGLQEAFERGLTPSEYRESVQPYIKEAEALGELPEEVQEKTGCETFTEWVEGMLQYYRVAYQGQNWDHDPVDDPLGNHTGIEQATEWVERAEAIAEQPDRSRKLEMANYALQDDVVPEEIEERAGESAKAITDVVIEAAESLEAQTRNQLEEADAPEIEEPNNPGSDS